MNIKQLLEVPSIEKINDVNSSNEIDSVYIGDLLSFVMANGKEGCLWLTVQKGINVIAVADLNDFAGILFVQSSIPDIDTIKKATELNIPLFKCKEDAYSIAKILISKGI